MSLEAWMISKIAEKVFSYASDKSQGAVESWMRDKLGLEPRKQAFKKALSKACKQFENNYPQWAASLFNASFFENEAAPVLAQFLASNGNPDPYQLAALWADSLNMHNSEQRTTLVRDLEPAATDFLDYMASALKSEQLLSDLNNSRALDQIVSELKAIRKKIEAGQATPGTRRDYLRWLIERNLYLDPRGTFQTQRRVQVKLDEVYISLQAQYEKTPESVDRDLLEQELAELEGKAGSTAIQNRELDGWHGHSPTLQKSRLFHYRNTPGEVLELADVVRRGSYVAILGDPGSGKSTLLHYLALKHAQALYSGRNEASSGLGSVHFPILIRIADYAEHGMLKGKSMSEFLADYHSMHECPKPGLGDLLASELHRGGCLVLLDGLDEVVSADDRRKVVERIEDFVRHHGNRPNRFVVTSRRAGYRSAPLGDPFEHYIVQDMDKAQIRRFLERWCRAVEAAETPELSQEAREVVAKREIDAVYRAIKDSPGVRLLASNPLLLRTLALIHRTGAQLPQKRVELYKLAADILARTWRTAQGIPESVLVEDKYLTRLLGKLAYWMHENKPTGIATQREVYRVLGQEYARIRGMEWDDDNPDIESEVHKFLRAVREHTGLFVERAPERYGFMHLTFEEYYVARYLVARSRDRAKFIREYLHNPRWEEPILLALGFVGLDSPEDAAELLETAVMMEGEEARNLGFTPSQYEELLGRDYLFTLRCLGDNIPARSGFVRRLSRRLVDELTRQTGSARFDRYQKALDERFKALQSSEEAPTLLPPLMEALWNADADVYHKALNCLIHLYEASPAVAAALIEALRDLNPQKRKMAAWSLRQVCEYSDKILPEVMTALKEALQDRDAHVRYMVVGSLGWVKTASPEIIDALGEALNDAYPRIRYQAALSLGQRGKVSAKIVVTLIEALEDTSAGVREEAADRLGRLGHIPMQASLALARVVCDPVSGVRRAAAWSLGRMGHSTPEVIAALTEALQDSVPEVRGYAAMSLGNLREASSVAVPDLLQSLRDDDPEVRSWAAESLGRSGNASLEVMKALLLALDDTSYDARTRVVPNSLAQLGQISTDALMLLTEQLGKSTSNNRRQGVEESLRQMSQASPEVVAVLIEALHNANPRVRTSIVRILRQMKPASPEVIGLFAEIQPDANLAVRAMAAATLGRADRGSPIAKTYLIRALGDTDSRVRSSAARSLGQLGQNSEDVTTALTTSLHDADPRVREWAATSLLQLRQVSPEAISAFIEALRGNNRDIGSIADHMVFEGKAIFSSPEVIEILNQALHDMNHHVRFWAAGSLVILGQASCAAITILVEMLGGPGSGLAADYLGGWSHKDPQAVEVLSDMLHDSRVRVRKWALEHLIGLRQISPQVIAALMEFLQNPEPDVRKYGVQQLGLIGQAPASSNVVVALSDVLQDQIVELQYAAAVSIGQLAPMAPEIRVRVLEALHNAKDGTIRRSSADLLGQQDHYEVSTVQALLHGLLDNEGGVRAASARALARLGQHFPRYADEIADKLIQSISSPDFDEPDFDKLDFDSFMRSTGYNHAYNGLWLLMTDPDLETIDGV